MDEKVFQSKEFAQFLLLGHVGLLIVFLVSKWTLDKNGSPDLFR